MSVFTEIEQHLVDTAIERAHREYRSGLAHLAGATFLTLLLATVVAVDWSLFYEVWRYLKAPMPGEEQLWGVGLLSLSSMILAMVFHLSVKDDPDGPLMRTVKITCAITLFSFALGAGGVLAAGVWTGGVEVLFGGGGDLAAQIQNFFAQAAQAAEPGPLKTFLEDHAFPALAGAFVFGVAGFTLCVFLAVNHLAKRIESKGPHIAALFDARRRCKLGKEVRAELRICEALEERQRALREALAASQLETAEMVIARLSGPLRTARSWVIARELEMHEHAPRFPRVLRDRPEVNLDPDKFEARVAAMEAYDTQAVLADLRSHLNAGA